MKNAILKLTLLSLITICTFGCATPKWTPTEGGAYVDPVGGYSVTLPATWSWVKMERDAPLRATRDGPQLQSISFLFREHGAAFPITGQRSSAEALPEDLAQLFVAEFRSEIGVGEVEVLNSAPVTISEREGFRVELAWRQANGLRIRAIAYGVATTRGLYLSYYRAPVLNYYGQHEGEFEQTMQTFRLPA